MGQSSACALQPRQQRSLPIGSSAHVRGRTDLRPPLESTWQRPKYNLSGSHDLHRPLDLPKHCVERNCLAGLAQRRVWIARLGFVFPSIVCKDLATWGTQAVRSSEALRGTRLLGWAGTKESVDPGSKRAVCWKKQDQKPAMPGPWCQKQ